MGKMWELKNWLFVVVYINGKSPKCFVFHFKWMIWRYPHFRKPPYGFHTKSTMNTRSAKKWPGLYLIFRHQAQINRGNSLEIRGTISILNPTPQKLMWFKIAEVT